MPSVGNSGQKKTVVVQMSVLSHAVVLSFVHSDDTTVMHVFVGRGGPGAPRGAGPMRGMTALLFYGHKHRLPKIQ